MSSIGGKKREQKDYVKKIGLFEAEVIAVNPSREKLEELLGMELEKDPEYLGEKDGVKTARVSFYLKDVNTDDTYNVSFFLENRVRKNKNEDKLQFINSVGQTTWAEDEDGLKEWFTKDRDVREAKVGEEELYNFLRNWLSKLDFRDSDASLVLDFKKLLRGNVSDIEDQVGGEYAGTVVALATIKTKEVDGEPKSFQVVNNKNFLSGYNIKFFKGKQYSQKDADKIKAILTGDNKDAKKKIKPHERFVASILDDEYPVKEFFGSTLGMLRDYDADENPATSTEMIKAGSADDDDEDGDGDY